MRISLVTREISHEKMFLIEKYRQIILYKVVNLALNINIANMNTVDYSIKIIIDYFSYCATFKCHQI